MLGVQSFENLTRDDEAENRLILTLCVGFGVHASVASSALRAVPAR